MKNSKNSATRSEGRVDEKLPIFRLLSLGLQHVLVMYAGAVAVPLIIGRALDLTPEQVALLISADLFCCGIVTIIQSYGVTKWFGIKLPVMMGVTFAAVGPMLAIAGQTKGVEGAQIIFGSIIAAGIFSMIVAPLVGKMVKLFPPVVTGSVILVIGISLMRIGINWIFGNPMAPATTPMMVDPAFSDWLATAQPPPPAGMKVVGSQPNPLYAPVLAMVMSAFVMVVIIGLARFAKGFVSNIAVLLGLLAGAILAIIIGKMTFAKVSSADWVGLVTPFTFGMPVFDTWAIITMCVVMIVVMIESTGMFLALGDLVGKPIGPKELTRGLRVDGLGTFIGGIFNTFPYTSFSQNVGLVGVTGIASRFVTVVAGIILLLMGLVPKLGAVIASIPDFVLGGAGLVMFGMVAATGIRILGSVNYDKNRNNLFIVALSVGFGMIPLIAPNFKIWLPHAIYPLIESGILLATAVAVLLNLLFNGMAGHSTEESMKAAKMAGE
ncbi:MAG: nucleobase:cation symporter-2 family protein [Candidatus Pacebacteria bacterium]|nr:nucleobase:cation symporter-2 family protein [Candidatus Paceibacterota bacterium]